MVRIDYPIITLAALWIMLYRDHMGLIRISLLCSVLHEMGHIIIWMCIKKTMPELIISPKGIGMNVCQSKLTNKQELILALAGPAMNFIFAVAIWCKIQYHASYWAYFFLGINLLIGGFNLLPIGKLDGKRICDNLLFR